MIDACPTPLSYAKQLAGYINDPSTIRVRTLESFGRAPTVERCLDLIKAGKGRPAGLPCRERFCSFSKCGHPVDGNTILDYNGIERCAQCEDARIAAKKAKQEAERQEFELLLKKRRAEQERHKAMVARRKAADKALHQAGYAGRSKVHTDLIADIAARFGLTLEDIRGNSRKDRFVDARAVIAVALRARGNSYPRCARYMGKVCHTSIINLCKKFPERAAKKPRLLEVLTEVIR